MLDESSLISNEEVLYPKGPLVCLWLVSGGRVSGPNMVIS